MNAPNNPVLHYLAVVRAARDFGLPIADLDRLAREFAPPRSSAEELAETVAAVLLERS